MTASRTFRQKAASRVSTAPAKRAPRQAPPKHGVRGPATAERIATRLEEDIVLGRRHPRERLIEQFAQWRAGGPQMETHVAANVQASALVFGSIESARGNALVKVQDYIASFG